MGFILTITYALIGAILCITIIGIPIGLGFFQISKFYLAPFSRSLVSRKDLETVTGEEQSTLTKIFYLIVRILYFPCGCISAFGSLCHIVGCFLSIIGIPCGIAEAKALSSFFNPINKVCVPRAVALEIERIKNEKTLQKYTQKNPNVQPTATQQATQPQIPPTQEVANEATEQQEITPQNETQEVQAETQQVLQVQPTHSVTTSAPNKNNAIIVAAVAGILLVIGLIAGYFTWYVPYATDRDALRTYVVANNVFLRSSKDAGVEYNILSKVPYGSELITYTQEGDWAQVKVNDVEGYVATAYLLEWDDFKQLNDVWGDQEAKEAIATAKCRFALHNYCKRNNLQTGKEGWQLHTLQKDIKPNYVSYPRLKNNYDKFTEFAFILRNNTSGERRLAIYSFDDMTEEPIFVYEEAAPSVGLIKNIKYKNNIYSVKYTDSNSAY